MEAGALQGGPNVHGRSMPQLGRHPAGLYLLFMVEMWERFSYYGMRALLVLYLVTVPERGGLGWSEREASQLYGWYTGLVYLTPIVGGWLADRFLGTRRALVIGGLIISLGHFSLAVTSMGFFYLGLLLIIIGTGFFKPNVSTMVGQLYIEGDARRDAGFTIFYMGINLGALLGTLVCGYLAESEQWGWHYGFAAAGVGMVLGLVNYLALRDRYLPGIGLPVASAAAEAKTVSKEGTHPVTREEKDRIWAIGIVALFVVFFWVAYEQAGSSMNLFALNRVDRFALGMEFPASWFQSINPALILLFSPVAALLWTRLGLLGREPTTVQKMAVGLLLLGAGFVLMVVAAVRSDQGIAVSPLWLVGVYALHTAGEICLSPVGLSLVTKVAPVRFGSLLMGVWFLSNFLANLIGGYVAGALKDIEQGKYFTILGGQGDFFLIFVLTSLVAGAILWVSAPRLTRLMHGRGQ